MRFPQTNACTSPRFFYGRHKGAITRPPWVWRLAVQDSSCLHNLRSTACQFEKIEAAADHLRIKCDGMGSGLFYPIDNGGNPVPKEVKNLKGYKLGMRNKK
jgi:hypothetical protein